MPENPSDHLTVEELRALSLGQLTETDLVRVSGHLGECSACCRRIEQLATEDSLLSRLRQNATRRGERLVSPAQRRLAVRALRHRHDTAAARQRVPEPGPASKQVGDYDILAEVGRGGMNERSIFFEALDRATPAERSAYLDAVCGGDGSSRQRVEALLHSHEEAGNFLDKTAPERLAAEQAAYGEPEQTPREPLLDDSAEPLAFLSPSSKPGSLGRLDHYEVLEVVGKGGMGVVMRARDSKLQRVVALKVLAAPLAASGSARQRFAREARAAAAVRDDHVIDIHAVCDDGPVPYLVMEFIDGCTLETLLRKGGPLEVKQILRIGIQAACGLAAAHKQGLIHRDVKPANILLENGVQRVKITDFGLARADDDASLTQSGIIAGTPQYMAPEQAAGEPISSRADLFSLGSVLYELCTGRPAFRAPTTVAVIRRVCDETPRPIREVNPDIPEPLCRLIERLQAKKPADRPASANEVADLLAGLLAGLQGQGPATLSVGTPSRPAPRRPRSSRPWLWASAALVLLSAGLVVGEATGVTNMHGTVIRLFSPDGTLVVEVDDPSVSVTVYGGDVVITGAGAKEIRLKPGQYKVEASKDGKVVRQELVTVTRNGRQVVRISKEPGPSAGTASAAAAWEKSVAALPPEKQVEAVTRRLRERNPRFTSDPVEPTIRDGVVTGLKFKTDWVSDLSPVRALTRLEWLECYGTPERMGMVTDLSPLHGLPLRQLIVSDNHVTDLSPLREMPLKSLSFARNRAVKDLTPLKGMPLEFLDCSHTTVADLSPLKGMKLTELWCSQTFVSDLMPLRGMSLKRLEAAYTRVSDLSPLRGMPLQCLWLKVAPVTDLSPLKGMPLKELLIDFQPERDAALLRSLTALEKINDKPAADFWKEVDGK
jgi:serine/threonine protein kinase